MSPAKKQTRKIIEIDEAKCNGCGLCVKACAEGAIAIVDGKAKLISDSYCDGLGACLGDCPEGALKIIEREAEEFSLPPGHMEAHAALHSQAAAPACPGSAARALRARLPHLGARQAGAQESLLGHWPVQLALVPPTAPYLNGADLVVCADCVPFAFRDFHARYLDGRAVVIGCPKLDDLDFYREKLRQLFAFAKPKRVTIVRMEVPCCGGLAKAGVDAFEAVREALPEGVTCEVHIIGINGTVINEQSF